MGDGLLWPGENRVVRDCKRDFADKVLDSQSHGFSRSHVLMLELGHKEGWVLKNWCFLIVVLEKTLESLSWTAGKTKQSILKGISPEYSLEGLMLKLKLQYFSYLIRTDESLEKSLMLGQIEGRGEEGIRGWDGWTASPMQWTSTWANSGGWWGTGIPGMLQSKGLQRVGHDWATEQQQQQLVVTCQSEYTTTLLE